MRMNWIAHALIREDGYGRYAMSIVRALSRMGVEVTPYLTSMLEIPGWMQRMAGLDFSKLSLLCGPPNEMKSVPGKAWLLTMTECSKIEWEWADRINVICERLIVPCEHNAEVFKSGGVGVPITVIHGGTDPVEFPILPWVNHDRPYTFVCMGDRGARKGIETCWSAFYKAFPDNPDVRLVIKSRANWMPGLTFTDKRVSRWSEDLDTMADVYAAGDCFLFPSMGEGWGMPPREAAMMGLPVIATRWSGLEAGIDHWAIPIEKFELVECPLVEGSVWAKADLDETVAHMRWCYENRTAAREKGLAAAKWLRENQTWDHSAAKLYDLMVN
jgi:glycosyltransferase involved in cell wall biosynthesis